jgi:predicted esterase
MLNCRDVPVHLVAGEHDGVIPASNIRHHYAAMRAAGMDVSYREVGETVAQMCTCHFRVLC